MSPCIEEYEKSRECFWFCCVLILQQKMLKHVCLQRIMSQYRRKRGMKYTARAEGLALREGGTDPYSDCRQVGEASRGLLWG